MVFCNAANYNYYTANVDSHNPYFNRWFSAIIWKKTFLGSFLVTILILIDGFLQYNQKKDNKKAKEGHNPYFNRWFSAINKQLANANYVE